MYMCYVIFVMLVSISLIYLSLSTLGPDPLQETFPCYILLDEVEFLVFIKLFQPLLLDSNQVQTFYWHAQYPHPYQHFSFHPFCSNFPFHWSIKYGGKNH